MVTAKRCCFTGHRPEKLNVDAKLVKVKLRIAVKQAINDGFTTFISGMARGVDIWGALVVLEERKINNEIKLICVSPYKGFEKYWSEREKLLYEDILKKADFVKYVCDGYSKSCFQIRNCYMVDRSERVIAVYNGKPSGTKNTVEYAKRKNVEVINLI